jgi:NAD(P)-dependent dehydrogenase (short-subunit alcohol dehydrogenase family)
MRDAVNAGHSMQSEIERVPLGRFADPKEIAEAISFLASPMSSYMSGASLIVDGSVFKILSWTSFADCVMRQRLFLPIRSTAS